MRFFDLLVADGQVAVPNNLKIPPLELCTFLGKDDNFLGHKNSNCVLFMDLVQIGLNEGRMRFGDKARPQM